MFDKSKLYDLGLIAKSADSLYNIVVNWAVLESLPLSKWEYNNEPYVDRAQYEKTLERRKEIDRKMFRQSAITALADLNRGLCSLGLGQLRFEELMEKKED